MPKSTGRRALVADDDSLVRSYLVALLESLSFSVAEAIDGLDAAQRVREARFTLVVLDCEIPKSRGLAVLPLVRKLQPRAWIVVVSGEHHPTDAQRLGADAFVRKGTMNFSSDLRQTISMKLLSEGERETPPQ